MRSARLALKKLLECRKIVARLGTEQDFVRLSAFEGEDVIVSDQNPEISGIYYRSGDTCIVEPPSAILSAQS